MKLLFVCTGNICRSPMAEGFFQKILLENSITDVEVDSVGIFALQGSPPSQEAVELGEMHGFEIGGLRARQVQKEDVESADLILVMTKRHMDWFKENYPDFEKKVCFLRSFSVDSAVGKEIPDPIGLGLEAYRTCFQFIKRSVEGLFKYLVINGKITKRRRDGLG